MPNFALNACFEKFFSLNRISIKKYFDRVIFCPNRLITKKIFQCFSFSTNRLANKKYFLSLTFLANRFSKKKYFRCAIFLTNRLSKRISNWLSKKSNSLMWSKIKYSVSLFFARSIGANIYKSFTYFFVQHDERQNIYFDCIVFLPSEHATKRENHCEKKYKKIVHLSRLNACF